VLGNAADVHSLDFVFRATGPGPTSITATATLSSSNDTNGANNTQSQTTTVIQGGDLGLTKTGSPSSVVGGANVTYTLTASNAGPNASGTIVVTDNLPPATTYVSSAGNGWSCSNAGSVVTCTRAGPHAAGAAAAGDHVLEPARLHWRQRLVAVVAHELGKAEQAIEGIAHLVGDERQHRRLRPARRLRDEAGPRFGLEALADADVAHRQRRQCLGAFARARDGEFESDRVGAAAHGDAPGGATCGRGNGLVEPGFGAAADDLVGTPAEHRAGRGVGEDDALGGVANEDGVGRGLEHAGQPRRAEPAPVLAGRGSAGAVASRQLEQVAHAGDENGGGVGFGDEVGSTEVERAHLGARIGEARHEDDRHGIEARIGAQCAADREAVKAGHVDVEQDDVGQQLARHRERLVAVAREVEVAERRQRAAQGMDGGDIVVDDEQARRPGLAGRHRRFARADAEGCRTPQLRSHPRRDLRSHQRLGDEVGRTRLERSDLEVGKVVAGREDDRYARQSAVGTQRRADIEIRHAGHVGVEQDEVGRVLASQPHGIDAGRRHPLVRIPGRQTAHHPQGRGVVVDEEEVAVVQWHSASFGRR